LKSGNSSPAEWLDWKKKMQVADEDVKTAIAELVAGKKLSGGYCMSNSYPSLKKRYQQESEELEKLKVDCLAPLADQEEATNLVLKLISSLNLLSQVMVPQQSDDLFQILKEMLGVHKTRLISYSALCQQRSIVKQYEEETRSKLVKELEEQIEGLEGRKKFYENNVSQAPDAEARKKAQDDLRKTNDVLDAKRSELTEKKGDDSVFDPSDADTFATQVVDDSDDEEEETEEQKVLRIKQEFRNEYESRGSKKRKAVQAPDGASILPPSPKKQRGIFGAISEAIFG
jgi:hypothetical protein